LGIRNACFHSGQRILRRQGSAGDHSGYRTDRSPDFPADNGDIASYRVGQRLLHMPAIPDRQEYRPLLSKRY
ncbi:MAG: hypothetical protein IJX14_00265, partial [Clostridia bacterium]|nr:hypothetical protein [Clostridia bacterium]